MITKNLIEGLQVLMPHYKVPDGYNTGAGHDTVYAYATSTPLSEDKVKRMIELGWTQEVYTEHEEFQTKHYDPEESWVAYV